MDDALLSRVEDAGINASAPPQQRWLDGWIVRTSPGKARRARCVYPVAAGRLPLEHKLALARAAFDAAGLPMFVRVSRFTEPPGLDTALAARGFVPLDDTLVMVCPQLPAAEPPPLPEGVELQHVASAHFAEIVGEWRGSPPAHRETHAQRLAHSPVPYQGFVLQRGGEVVACGQFAAEADLAGLYDVFTRESARGAGLARQLCEHLLWRAARQGAKVGYLQTEAGNEPARRTYERLGFAVAYGYCYWQAPAA